MGAWIETIMPCSPDRMAGVAPVWVRGLKRRRLVLGVQFGCRTRMGAWIETNA